MSGPEKLKKLSADTKQVQKTQLSDARRYHPDDVRFYFGSWVLGFAGIALGGEIVYAMLKGCENLQATLDAFGLFDAMFMTLVGAVFAFYFNERRRDG